MIEDEGLEEPAIVPPREEIEPEEPDLHPLPFSINPLPCAACGKTSNIKVIGITHNIYHERFLTMLCGTCNSIIFFQMDNNIQTANTKSDKGVFYC